MPMSFKAQPEMNRDGPAVRLDAAPEPLLPAAKQDTRRCEARAPASSSLAVEDRMRNPGSFMCTTHVAKMSRRRFRGPRLCRCFRLNLCGIALWNVAT